MEELRLVVVWRWLLEERRESKRGCKVIVGGCGSEYQLRYRSRGRWRWRRGWRYISQVLHLSSIFLIVQTRLWYWKASVRAKYAGFILFPVSTYLLLHGYTFNVPDIGICDRSSRVAKVRRCSCNEVYLFPSSLSTALLNTHRKCLETSRVSKLLKSPRDDSEL